MKKLFGATALLLASTLTIATSGCALEEFDDTADGDEAASNMSPDDEGDILATSDEEPQAAGCTATANWQTIVRTGKSASTAKITTLNVGTTIASDCGGTQGVAYSACGVQSGQYWLRVYGPNYIGYVASACVTYNF